MCVCEDINLMFGPTDGWSVVCSPFIPKYLSSPRSITADGVIYLIADNTKKVYTYDPDANMWQKVGLPLHTHESAEMNTIIKLDSK